MWLFIKYDTPPSFLQNIEIVNILQLKEIVINFAELTMNAFLSNSTLGRRSPPLSLVLRQKALLCFVVFSGLKHVEGQYIVYEKQKDDVVMSCLDSMQMNRGDSKPLVQYSRSHVSDTHTHTHSGNDYGNDYNRGCHHRILHHVKN